MVRGAEILAKKGYPSHVIAALPPNARVLPKTPQSGGRPVIVGVRDLGQLSMAQSVGLKGTWRGMRGEFEVLSPSFQRSQLTEKERIFVLPVERPGGEIISFNPFGIKGVGGWARGIYHKPQTPEIKGAIDVRPLTRPEALQVMRQITRGEQVELWRVGAELPYPMSIAPSKIPMKPYIPTAEAKKFQIFPTSPFISLLERLRGRS